MWTPPKWLFKIYSSKQQAYTHTHKLHTFLVVAPKHFYLKVKTMKTEKIIICF